MNAERFEQLAEAYGGDVRRWPEAERAAAVAFADAEQAVARQMLFQAKQLDAALDAVSPGVVSQMLRDRVLGSAPVREQRVSRPSRWFWLPGAALAAACAAGALLGAVLMDRATAPARADQILVADAEMTLADSDTAESL